MDNPLVPQNSTPSRPTWRALSEELKALLLAGRSDLIEQAPAMLAEVQTHLEGLRDDVYRPADPAELMRILSQRFAVFPQPDRSDGEWSAWWADYKDALGDLSAPALEAAMAGYVKEPDSEFFPKPGRIRELAKTLSNRASRAYYTAQAAISSARLRAMPMDEIETIAPQPSEEQRAQVMTMLDEYRRVFSAKRPPDRPERAPTPVVVDEHGISPMMREYLPQQGGR